MQLPQAKLTRVRKLNLAKLVTYGFLFCLFIALGISTVYRSGPHLIRGETWGSTKHRTDFTVYQAAGKAILEGTNIYDAHNIRGWYYMYLPAFACALIPLSLVNEFWGSLIWYLLSASMVAHGLYLSTRMATEIFSNENVDRFWLSSLTLLLISWPTLSGLARGQASILLTYSVILAVWYSRNNRPWSSGFWLSTSIVLKAFPALLLLYFLAKKKIKLAFATGCWLIMLLFVIPSVIFGPSVNFALLDRWVNAIALPANNPDISESNIRYSQMINPRIAKNQTIQAVSIRWLAGATSQTALPEREPLARRIAMILCAILVAITIWFCFRRIGQIHQAANLLEICTIILLMLFTSPVSWTHNYTVAILPLSVAVAGAVLCKQRKIKKTFQIALITYAIASIGSLAVKQFHIRGVFLAGNIVLWGALLIVIWISQKNCLNNVVPPASSQ